MSTEGPVGGPRPPEGERFVAAGRVRRAHGTAGELRLGLSVPPAELGPLSRLHLGLDARAGARLDRLMVARPGVPPPWEALAAPAAAPAGGRCLGLTVLGCRAAGEDALVRLEGVVDRELAAVLVGAEVALPVSCLPPLGPGELWGFALVGLRAEDEAGAPLGQLVGIDGRGPQLVGELLGADGRRALVPLVPGILLGVPPGEGRAVLRLPAGLWDL